MRLPIDRPVLCPTLIGRSAFVEAIDRILQDVVATHGRVLLVAGEAGIGKSRLVAEARAHADRLGFLVLEGQCFETDRSVPYAAIVDLLRGFGGGRLPAEIVDRIGPTARDLLTLLPEIAPLLPDAPPPVPLDHESERRRVYHALGQIFVGLASTQPVIAVVEDLHWSDDLTLDFLLQLAHRCTRLPLLLLLTYRTDEVQPDLAHLLAELDRARLTSQLVLTPLAAPEVDAMLQAIFTLDRPVRPDFLDAIVELTDGNPFFIEEVLTSLVAAGDIFYADGRWDRLPIDELRIPRSIEDAVRRRVAQLSDHARATLVLAAVAGRRFDFALLQEVTGGDEIELLRQIRELIAAQLVVETAPDQFVFRHALTRRAVYAGLLGREQRTLHQRIAEAIERVYAGSLDPHLADLAHHFAEAGLPVKALEYARRVGERALAMHAPRVAVDHFTRAIDAAQTLDLPRDPALHRARGQAYETLGEFERARSDLEDALAAARDLRDSRTEWTNLVDLGFLWASRDYGRSREYFHQALDLAHQIGDPSLIAHSLNRLSNWLMNADEPVEASRYHEEALATFEALGDRHGVAATLDLLGLAISSRNDWDRAISCYERAAALFEELDDRRGLAWSLAMLSLLDLPPWCYEVDVSPAVDAAAAIDRCEVALGITREIGWRAGEAYLLGMFGSSLGSIGDYARALTLVRASFAVAEEIEHRQWVAFAHSNAGGVYLDLLALPIARHHFEQAHALARALGSTFLSLGTAALLASFDLLDGRLDQAEARLEAAFGTDDRGDSAMRQVGLRVWAELALARGDAALALTIVDRLIASIPPRSAAPVFPRLSLLRGRALQALNRLDEAEATLRSLQEALAGQALRPFLWRAHAALGQLYRAAKRQAEMDREFAAARAIVEELAAGIPDDPVPDLGGISLRTQFLQAATASFPRPRQLTPLQAAKQQYGGLTEREREVAALIARGRSNREIAALLVVGERTVQTHVANIFAKLGFTSRAQIASWAVANGLVADEG